MKINIDYRRKIPADFNDKVTSNSEITFSYIEYAVSSKHEKGLDSTLRRIWGRIQRKMEAAIEAQADDVELDAAEFDFIRKSVEDTKYPPAYSKYILILEDEIERVKESMKDTK